MTAQDSLVQGLHVFSTGIGSIHAEHRYGTRLPQMWWVLFSRNWIEVPINVFVLEHPKGLVLFDAGLDTAVLTNPSYVDSVIGRFFMRRLFRIRMRPDETLTNKLAGLGFDAADVSFNWMITEWNEPPRKSNLHLAYDGGAGKLEFSGSYANDAGETVHFDSEGLPSVDPRRNGSISIEGANGDVITVEFIDISHEGGVSIRLNDGAAQEIGLNSF